ncbi:MAG: CDP-alcohol phosphatidyltransferase family protein [Bacillota bacterium]
MNAIDQQRLSKEQRREHRRRRLRRKGRRAYIRSVYSLPSLATLGNAVCGFGAMYIAGLDSGTPTMDHWTSFFAQRPFIAAAYLIFLAMIFDALDGRLARFTRHTTDFGGQLDSLADAVSFGVAPAFLALQLFRDYVTDAHIALPVVLSRLIWAVAALFMSCALLRLARFNVSNQHGEQHHFSFLGLPSPGAAGAVASFALMQQDLLHSKIAFFERLSTICVWLLPIVVLLTGLLMVSTFRYPHLVNRYLRGKRSLARLIGVLVLALLVVVAHQYTIAIGSMIYALWGPVSWAYLRSKPKTAAETPTPLPQSSPRP